MHIVQCDGKTFIHAAERQVEVAANQQTGAGHRTHLAIQQCQPIGARIVVPRQAKSMFAEMGQAHDHAAMLYPAVAV